MRRLLILAMMMMAAFAFGWVDREGTGTTTREANLRAGPDAASNVIFRLPEGALLMIVGEEGDYYHVSDGKIEGWVWARMLEEIKDKGVKKHYFTVIGEGVAVKTAAGQGLDRGTLKPGTIVRLISVYTTWFKVWYDPPGNRAEQVEGWVWASSVRLSK